MNQICDACVKIIHLMYANSHLPKVVWGHYLLANRPTSHHHPHTTHHPFPPVPHNLLLGMECGSTSHCTWPDEVEEALGLTPSPSVALNPDLEPFSPAAFGFDWGEKLSFTDLEASFGSMSPVPSECGQRRPEAAATDVHSHQSRPHRRPC